MTSVFADTFYFIALLNADDDAHGAAAGYSTDNAVRFVTTAWVLTELADGLAETSGRTIFAGLLNDLRADARVDVVDADAQLWQRGIALYDSRRDKGWSLTDCISFVVMTDRKITDALTGDRHFEQAGFRALLT
jgi:predicted nucleic acid-binding protein